MRLRTITIPVPVSDDAPPTQDVRDLAAVESGHLRSLVGHDDLSTSPESIVYALAHQERKRKARLLTRDGAGRPVGAAEASMPVSDNRHVGYFVPSWVGPGPDDEPVTESEVLDELWAAALPALQEAGRTTVQGWTLHTGGPDTPRLTPATGAGQLPEDERARWFLARGFTLEQVELYSVQELTPEVVAAARAALTNTPGYTLRTWTGPTPEELLDGMAHLRRRMSTDVPSGALDQEEEVWDADRVRELDQRIAGLGMVPITAVALAEDGEAVAYSTVEIPPEAPACAHQQDTLVLREHRGHGLGLRVKAAVVAELTDHHPQVRRVHTWNAAENTHMLAINTALGYRQVGAEGGWQWRSSEPRDPDEDRPGAR